MGLVPVGTRIRPEDRSRLEQMAAERGLTVAALLREMVELGVAGAAPRKRRRRRVSLAELRAMVDKQLRGALRPTGDPAKAMAFVGCGRSRRSDISVHHDDYLADLRE